MLDPSSKFSIPNGDAFYFTPFQSLSQRFNSRVVVTASTSPCRDLSRTIGNQLQVTIVSIGWPIGEESGSIGSMNLRPRQFPILIFGGEITTPIAIIAGFEAAGSVANGGARPRVRIGDCVGIGHYILNCEQFNAIVFLFSIVSATAATRMKTTYKCTIRKVLLMRNLFELRVHIYIYF